MEHIIVQRKRSHPFARKVKQIDKEIKRLDFISGILDVIIPIAITGTILNLMYHLMG